MAFTCSPTRPATVTVANDSWTIRAERVGNTNVTYTVTVICVSAL